MKKQKNGDASPGVSITPTLLALCAALARRLEADTEEVEEVQRPNSSKVSYNLYTGRDEAGF